MSRNIAAIRAMAQELDGDDAVIGTDLSGTIVYWNAKAEQLYGWRSAEALGRDIIEVTPTLMSKAEADQIMSTLGQGKEWSGPFMVKDRHGQPMIVHVEDKPVLVDGEVVGVVGVSRPTTVGG